jgi:transcription initiation factor TFIID subunit TAF12
MQVVNGYICMNCCDVDKARLGQDPHQQTNQIQKQLQQLVDPLQKQLKQLIDPRASGRFGPAVTFGGSLQALADGDATTAALPSQTTSAASGQGSASLDILV